MRMIVTSELAFFSGQGIVFSFLIHSFFVLIGGALLIYGLKKYGSRSGLLVAVGYMAVTLIATLLSQQLNGFLFEIVALGLTSPWRMVVPCYNLYNSCALTLGLAFVCALLNAAILYFLVVWLTRSKQEA